MKMALLNYGSSLLKDKPYNGGQWTTARYNSFIKSALRSASQRWPPKYSVLNKAKLGKRINKSSGRMAEHFLCKACCEAFPAKEVQVDHIMPIINPVKGFISWDDVIKNMFCEEHNLQVLCKDCHTIKTKQERQITNE